MKDNIAGGLLRRLSDRNVPTHARRPPHPTQPNPKQKQEQNQNNHQKKNTKTSPEEPALWLKSVRALSGYLGRQLKELTQPCRIRQAGGGMAGGMVTLLPRSTPDQALKSGDPNNSLNRTGCAPMRRQATGRGHPIEVIGATFPGLRPSSAGTPCRWRQARFAFRATGRQSLSHMRRWRREGPGRRATSTMVRRRQGGR